MDSGRMNDPAQTPSAGNPPAGWYPDAAIGGLRWWDGTQWTQHTHVAAAPTQQPAAPQRPAVDPATINPADFVEPFVAPDASRMRTFAIGGAVLLVLLLVGGLLLANSLGDDAGSDPSTSERATQANLRLAQTAIETLASDQNGAYLNASPERLKVLEPELDETAVEVASNQTGYTITSIDESTGTSFVIVRDSASGLTTLTCNQPGTGTCSADGTWGEQIDP